MCAGHSLHKADWLKIALGLAAAGTGAGALGYGPLAGVLGGAAGAGATGAADAAALGMLQPAEEAALTAEELGPGAGAAGLTGREGMDYGALARAKGLLNSPTTKMVGKGLMGAQKAGLLGGKPQATPLAAPQPGGGPQMPGAPSSAQIAFPDAYQPAPPYFPLDEILRKRMREGY